MLKFNSVKIMILALALIAVQENSSIAKDSDIDDPIPAPGEEIIHSAIPVAPPVVPKPVKNKNKASAQEPAETTNGVPADFVPNGETMSQPENDDVDEAEDTHLIRKSPVSSIVDLEQRQGEPLSIIKVVISVPHSQKPIDTIIAYPYPMKPPLIRKPIEKLPTDRKTLQSYLFSSGYASRIDPKRPYPAMGWRWQYAFRAACRRAGISKPVNIVSAYSWCDKMVPYIIPEVVKINAMENKRMDRYAKALDEFEKTGMEIETEAVRHGLYPIVFKNRGAGRFIAKVPAGSWWVSATHKVPGLTYYWQAPITLAPNQTMPLQMREDNAMLVTGGW